MRIVNKSIGAALLFGIGALVVTDTASAQNRRQLFTNEQVTLACQQYVNALYPASQGATDRARQSVMVACLRRKGR